MYMYTQECVHVHVYHMHVYASTCMHMHEIHVNMQLADENLSDKKVAQKLFTPGFERGFVPTKPKEFLVHHTKMRGQTH